MTIENVIEPFCKQLGIRSWWYMPTKPLTARFDFLCNVCRKSWRVDVDAGNAAERVSDRAERIVRELSTAHDEHKCALELGAAGR